jgi:hypothetical protein
MFHMALKEPGKASLRIAAILSQGSLPNMAASIAPATSALIAATRSSS